MKTLRGKIIGLDTMVFIYHIEDYSEYAVLTEGIFDEVENGHLKAVTSIVTILEILVKPKKEGNLMAVNYYKDLIMTFPNLQVLNVDINVSDKASDLRAKYGIKTPDAIQIATAIVSGADYFITNDERLKLVSDINVLLLNELP